MESRKDLKKMFPHLLKELEGSENKVKIDSVRKNPEEAELMAEAEVAMPEEEVEVQDGTVEAVELEEAPVEAADAAEAESAPEQDKFRHYNPTVVDFLRRCDTDSQAEEIIAYMCKKGELTEDHASQLRTQIKKAGLRSFGPKKQTDYYFKESGFC